jgi:putrescine aminotransferase
VAVEGSGAGELLDRFARHVNPGLARAFRLMGLDRVEHTGRGAHLVTEDGEEYLDLAGGYGVHILGYMHPQVVAAARRQLEEGLALGSRLLLSRPAVDLAERLAALMPGEMPLAFFVNSGAEAVEAALKFARLSTGRPDLVATEGAFHGKTMGALSLTGRPQYQDPFRPLMGGVRRVPFGDADAVRAALDRQVAAVVVEPIQGEAGVVVPPEGYLTELRRACDQVGALLVLDEVQTGMGRTGQFLACQHEAVEPDLVCLAKGLGGGVMPIGAVCGTERAMGFLDDRPLIHTSTFGGGALAATVALATLDVLADGVLIKRAAKLGRTTLDDLVPLAARHPRVLREVRGRGLMIGLEFTTEGAAGVAMKQLFEDHVIPLYTLNNPRVIRLLPGLVIEAADLRRGVAAIDRAVAEADAVYDELEEEGADAAGLGREATAHA